MGESGGDELTKNWKMKMVVKTVMIMMVMVMVMIVVAKIISDPTHFLHANYDLLPSGRRHRMPAVRTQRAMKSFIPSSIKLLNH